MNSLSPTDEVDRLRTTYNEIRQRIKRVQAESPLAAEQVDLLAVSKRQPLSRVEALLQLGHQLFGENRIQEALSKWPDLQQRYPDVILHGIGGLQTNKVKEALQLFDVIETLDRPKLANVLTKHWDTLPDRRTQELFIQVNIGEEPQKSGVLPLEAEDFIVWCRNDLRLPVTGLMCIPPAHEPPAPYFALLHKMATTHDLPKISMGMSNDFEIAVQLGSTEVRVGSCLFGIRQS